MTAYVIITTILLARFFFNLYKILSTSRLHQTVKYKTATIVLIKEELTPHSFLHYIFLNKEDYLNDDIEQEILIHEYAHVQQRHSVDLLCMEIIQLICWFNPLLFFYRKAIQLNHEFLADEAVINSSKNIYNYQCLLLHEASKKKSFTLTSQFNYSITKKRILMMTKSKSTWNAWCRQIALIPICACCFIIFSKRSIAQDTSVIPQKEETVITSKQDGVSQGLLNEYAEIVNKHKKINTNGYETYGGFSEEETSRLEKIYLSMSEEQQKNQMVIFIPVGPPFQKDVPTKAQVEDWKNRKMYGVWIDGKKVSNAILSNYSNTDFAHNYVSKLSKNARQNVSYFYQVDLMTTKYYEAYYKKQLERKDKYFIGFKMKKN